MGAEGNYPENITLEEIKKRFLSKKEKCKHKISKILIGEAPPHKYRNYFYNTGIPWKSGNPNGTDYCWTKAIKDALFPCSSFLSQIDFLVACAKKGFLLIDLLPYAISYKGKRNTKAYKTDVSNAIVKLLKDFDGTDCLEKKIAIAFGLKSFGEIILNNSTIVTLINGWITSNSKTLTPPAVIEEPRLCCCPLFQSKYLRVCGARGYYHPLSCLLIQAGIK